MLPRNGYSKNELQILNARWERLAGTTFCDDKKPGLAELRKTQRVPEFDRLADNRLVQGAFRYGLMEEQNFDLYDLIAACLDRVARYRADDNLEHLIDAGNMLRLEFYWQSKQGKKCIPVDEGEHTKKKGV